MMDYHQPVMLQPSVDGLDIKPGGIYVDATFGGGGHSREILKRLAGGRLYAFDQDADVVEYLPDDEKFTFIQHNFRFLKNFLRYYKVDAIDGLLADLGVSSHHFDAAHRGFSFRFDAPIDMRMNQQSGISARELLNSYSEEQLANVFFEYGELHSSRKIARKIILYRSNNTISESRHLIEAIAELVPRQAENQFLAKLYQAIRIEVNHEIDYLKELLIQSLEFLKPGGRLVVISYHSLEDRVVKTFIKNGTFKEEQGIDLYGSKASVFKAINKKVIIPDEQELKNNSRARSAKLRIAEKL